MLSGRRITRQVIQSDLSWAWLGPARSSGVRETESLMR